MALGALSSVNSSMRLLLPDAPSPSHAAPTFHSIRCSAMEMKPHSIAHDSAPDLEFSQRLRSSHHLAHATAPSAISTCADGNRAAGADSRSLQLSASKEAFAQHKFRELRSRLRALESFHDTMYHSGLASRLASDISGR
eukprot:TRINITY_DN27132_c0_g1_i1.p2 TRINITY_DN27132_c0_g1~~TRINITY_DN27132_c0_g1_i1.p2  ORF type:complete len:139 (+),score=14.05 TRINITY_DN27132_c0_g1_i1:415-831(+)